MRMYVGNRRENPTSNQSKRDSSTAQADAFAQKRTRKKMRRLAPVGMTGLGLGVSTKAIGMTGFRAGCLDEGDGSEPDLDGWYGCVRWGSGLCSN